MTLSSTTTKKLPDPDEAKIFEPAWLLDYWACIKRWRPIWALRGMIASGTLMLFCSLVLPKIENSVVFPATDLIGGLLGFALLWGFGTLLFDLAFCWQRYINTERSWLDRLWKDK